MVVSSNLTGLRNKPILVLVKSGEIAYDSLMKTPTLPANCVHYVFARSALLFVSLLLVCFGLLPAAQAVVPPPDGGYPNFNTAEGQNALFSLTTGRWNTALGALALFSDTTGTGNTATGINVLRNNVTGGFNTGVGLNALFNNTASYNSALGSYALFSNTTGSQNMANGAFALSSNTTGFNNTANGFAALKNNSTGNNNTANGANALYTNAAGDFNTANGVAALGNNTIGSRNTANGVSALTTNINGNENTANGYQALRSNTAGGGNTANGALALENNLDGNLNTATGESALFLNTTGFRNTAIGAFALSGNITGGRNTAIGASAGDQITGEGNVCIGDSVSGSVGASDTTWIRNVYFTVQPVVGTNPDYVTVNSTGRLGRANVSSRRYKHDIKPMDKASEVLYALKPVSFRYHKQYDATQTIAFGLIAEEVAEVNPDLVGRNLMGEPESVRYEQINAMLLNEFLKEHRKNEEQEATIARQQKQIEALSTGLEKLSAQLEANKPTPQVVANK